MQRFEIHKQRVLHLENWILLNMSVNTIEKSRYDWPVLIMGLSTFKCT